MLSVYGVLVLVATTGGALWPGCVAVVLPFAAGIVLATVEETRTDYTGPDPGLPWWLSFVFCLLLAFLALPWTLLGYWLRKLVT